MNNFLLHSYFHSHSCLSQLVVQVGAIPQHSDPPDELSVFYNRAAMLKKLEEVGFENINVYDEGHFHFYTPWQFLFPITHTY